MHKRGSDPAKTKYIRIKTDLHHPDAGRYVTYGIAAVQNGEVILEAKDLSTDGEEVGALVLECERSDLDPVHLPDVAADFVMGKGYRRG